MTQSSQKIPPCKSARIAARLRVKNLLRRMTLEEKDTIEMADELATRRQQAVTA